MVKTTACLQATADPSSEEAHSHTRRSPGAIRTMNFPPLNFANIRTYPVADRANKVALEALPSLSTAGATFADFLQKLPDFLAVQDFRKTVSAVATAVRNQRPVLPSTGAHSIKVGLNPIFVNAMRRGSLTRLPSMVPVRFVTSSCATKVRRVKTCNGVLMTAVSGW